MQRLFYAVQSRAAVTAGLARLAEVEELPFDLPSPDEVASVDDDSITTEIDISGQLPAKISAMRAHGTQIKVWLDRWNNGDGIAAYALSNGIAQPVVDTEHFVLASGDPDGCANDLFGGLGPIGESVGNR